LILYRAVVRRNRSSRARGSMHWGASPPARVGLVTQVAPQVGNGQRSTHRRLKASMKESNGGGISKEDNPDKCEQLVARPTRPSKEIRQNQGLGSSNRANGKSPRPVGDPIWIVARNTRRGHAGERHGSRSPGVTKLMFNPPLYEMLKPDQAGVSSVRSG